MPQKIQAVGTFLYKLDDQTKNNLWSGSIQPNNGHDPIHAQKAAKLFAAAEDLLAALKDIVDCPFEIDTATISHMGLEPTMQMAPTQVIGNMSIALQRLRNAKAAIAKAEQE
jgi:hypothetical protein